MLLVQYFVPGFRGCMQGCIFSELPGGGDLKLEPYGNFFILFNTFSTRKFIYFPLKFIYFPLKFIYFPLTIIYFLKQIIYFLNSADK